MERWLGLVERTLAVDPAAAREVVATATLVRGYADTYKRGLVNWNAIMEVWSSRCSGGKLPRAQFADAVLQARLAASKDPEGEALSRLAPSAACPPPARSPRNSSSSLSRAPRREGPDKRRARP